MADGIHTANGKAFEYACLIALYETLCKEQAVVIEDTIPLYTAKKHYEQMDLVLKQKLDKAAAAAIRVIIPLEPQLKYPSFNSPLYLHKDNKVMLEMYCVYDVKIHGKLGCHVNITTMQ